MDIHTIRKLTAASAHHPGSSSYKSKKNWDFFTREIRFGKNLSSGKKQNFYLELSIMLKAGVDIRSALQLISGEHRKHVEKELFFSIIDRVVAGSTLSEALACSGKFTMYEIYTIQIGEETGRLAEVLKELAIFYQKKISQRRQIFGALAYPAMVLLVAVTAIIFMVSYVVPMFSDIFARSGDDLPAVTRFVLMISVLTKQYTQTVLLLLVALAFILYWQRQALWLKKLSSSILFSIPVWGNLVHKIYLSQFCHTLAMLLASRISIVQSIQLTKRIMQLYSFEHALKEVEQDIIRGVSIHKALQKHKIFPPKMIVMIKVGEEVNELGSFFKQLSDQYSADVEHQSAILSKIIEPLTIILLGLIVGVILIAMYLPLFKMGQQF